MPPGFLEFAKIVFSARQDVPAGIGQSWGIYVAEPIRAHATLLPKLSHNVTEHLVGLQVVREISCQVLLSQGRGNPCGCPRLGRHETCPYLLRTYEMDV